MSEDDSRQKLIALLLKAIQQKAEMKHLMATALPDGLDHLIAELEAEGYPDGRQGLDA